MEVLVSQPTPTNHTPSASHNHPSLFRLVKNKTTETMAAAVTRRGKKKAPTPKKAAQDVSHGDVTEEESIHDDNGDVPMDDVDAIPEISDKASDGEGNDSNESDVKEEDMDEDTNGKSKSKKSNKNKKKQPNEATAIPFMDTFYQLSSDDANERALAARDLIRHCFFSDNGLNAKDAAYAITRLLNGLCTGRAASRQGFASCLSSFLRMAYSSSSDGGTLMTILKEDEFAKALLKDVMDDDEGVDGKTPAIVLRQKLLTTTQFIPPEEKGKKGGGDKFGGKMKGMEERDHAFGRLFGILAMVRSGVLGLDGFPSSVRCLVCV